MILKRLAQVVCTTSLAVIAMTGSAFATNITYNTNQPDTGFNMGTPGPGSPNFITDVQGSATATLQYNDNIGSTSGPSNINLGNFELTCSGCTISTATGAVGVTFAAFYIDVEVDDTTDGAIGDFIGFSSGGTVYSDVSNISINWNQMPLSLGPNKAGDVISGSFGNTIFTIQNPTLIVAPNAGQQTPGETTLSATLTEISSTPEPQTFAMIGGGLFMLGLAKRKALKRN